MLEIHLAFQYYLLIKVMIMHLEVILVVNIFFREREREIDLVDGAFMVMQRQLLTSVINLPHDEL